MDLITLKNKINTVRTVEKITHIMRLTSMSEHTNLQKSGGQLKNYIDHIKQLLRKVAKIRQNETVNNENSAELIYKKPYFCIIIGSQKGLCGNFNTKLLPIIEAFLQDKSTEEVDFALIGKQIIPLMTDYKKISVTYEEDFFSNKTKEAIVEKLIFSFPHYEKIYIISNEFKTFFLQVAGLSLISVPQDNISKESDIIMGNLDQYMLEEPIDDIFQVLIQNYIRSQFFYFLHQSLLAEHAARFAAMDSATRNAQQVLEETKTLFNKLRQTKITTEVTELSSHF